jgi:hypothetical protein
VNEKESEMNSQQRRASAAEREAQRVFKQPESKKVLSEHEREQNALRENLRRLRAERLSRESVARDDRGKKNN